MIESSYIEILPHIYPHNPRARMDNYTYDPVGDIARAGGS